MSFLITRILALAILCSTLSSGITAQDSGSQSTKPTIEIEGYQPEKDLFLERGAKFMVLIQGAEGSRLRATYRPGSQVETPVELGVVKDGKVEWTPSQAGLAKLEVLTTVPAEDGADTDKVLVDRVVSIKLGPGFPIGLVIMIVAGGILFFGAFASIRALLRT